MFAQGQRLRKAETTVFINGFNDRDHANDGATRERLLKGELHAIRAPISEKA